MVKKHLLRLPYEVIINLSSIFFKCYYLTGITDLWNKLYKLTTHIKLPEIQSFCNSGSKMIQNCIKYMSY